MLFINNWWSDFSLNSLIVVFFSSTLLVLVTHVSNCFVDSTLIKVKHTTNSLLLIPLTSIHVIVNKCCIESNNSIIFWTIFDVMSPRNLTKSFYFGYFLSSIMMDSIKILWTIFEKFCSTMTNSLWSTFVQQTWSNWNKIQSQPKSIVYNIHIYIRSLSNVWIEYNWHICIRIVVPLKWIFSCFNRLFSIS